MPQPLALFKVEFLQGPSTILRLEVTPTHSQTIPGSHREAYLSCVMRMLLLLVYRHIFQHDKKCASKIYTVGNVYGCGEELVMGYSTTAGTEVRGCAHFSPPTPGRATATAGLCLTCISGYRAFQSWRSVSFR